MVDYKLILDYVESIGQGDIRSIALNNDSSTLLDVLGIIEKHKEQLIEFDPNISIYEKNINSALKLCEKKYISNLKK